MRLIVSIDFVLRGAFTSMIVVELPVLGTLIYTNPSLKTFHLSSRTIVCVVACGRGVVVLSPFAAPAHLRYEAWQISDPSAG